MTMAFICLPFSRYIHEHHGSFFVLLDKMEIFKWQIHNFQDLLFFCDYVYGQVIVKTAHAECLHLVW